jgi:hypothetical protein
MPAEEFVAMASDPAVLGNPLLKTQHFIGGTRWEKVSEDEMIGYHQLRVPHQRYTDETMSKVAVKGHAHSFNLHWYKKVDGEWKFAGLNPDIRWFEYDFDKVFAEGRDSFGEAKARQAESQRRRENEPSFIPWILRIKIFKLQTNVQGMRMKKTDTFLFKQIRSILWLRHSTASRCPN